MFRLLRRVFFLLYFPMFTDSVIYKANFKISQIGFQFVSTSLADSIHIDINTKTISQCVRLCTNYISCRTITFDSSIHQCSLFSAWNFEGNISSSSITSQIAFIKQEPIFYTSYLQSCIPSYDPINRYMQCVNNMWICPDRYFFNGSVCEHQRSLKQSCQNDQWCDSTKYLSCSTYSSQCRCDSSMTWNGSICISGKHLNNKYKQVRPCLIISSLSIG